LPGLDLYASGYRPWRAPSCVVTPINYASFIAARVVLADGPIQWLGIAGWARTSDAGGISRQHEPATARPARRALPVRRLAVVREAARGRRARRLRVPSPALPEALPAAGGAMG